MLSCFPNVICPVFISDQVCGNKKMHVRNLVTRVVCSLTNQPWWALRLIKMGGKRSAGVSFIVSTWSGFCCKNLISITNIKTDN